MPTVFEVQVSNYLGRHMNLLSCSLVSVSRYSNLILRGFSLASHCINVENANAWWVRPLPPPPW